MNTITQTSIYTNYNTGNFLGSLNELSEVLSAIPYDNLVDTLNKEQSESGGRWGYSNEAMFRALLTYHFYNYHCFQDFVDELQRNGGLRECIGFHPHIISIWKDGTREIKVQLAPSSSTFSKFKKRLHNKFDDIDRIFNECVAELYDRLKDFGEVLAGDGKIIESCANEKTDKTKPDGRSEADAEWTVKEYYDKKRNLIDRESFFGFRVHILCDATYELPVSFSVTPANVGEQSILKDMIREMPESISCAGRHLIADRGYDDSEIRELLKDRDIKPIIPTRHLWQGDNTRQYQNTDLVYNEDGEVFYVNNKCEKILLKAVGYDKQTDSQRYTFHPKDYHKSDGLNNKVFRVKCDEYPRIFPPVAQTTYKFERLYAKRTAVERINSRIDSTYRFENHKIRGENSMRLKLSLALIIMLTKKVTDP